MPSFPPLRSLVASLALATLFQSSAADAKTLIETEYKTKKGCKVIFLQSPQMPIADRAFSELIWSGKCKAGYAEGQGELVAKKKDIEIRFTAVLVSGRLDGKGSYEAFKNDGERETFDGNFLSGLKHGEGVQTRYKNDAVLFQYRGGFTEGEPSGFGRIEKGGGSYIGKFLEGKPVGNATIIFPNKLIYEGETKEGKPHGHGKLTKTDGSIISGLFENGKNPATGTISFKNGAKYEGQIQNALPHGSGTLTAPNGHIYKGGFVQGKPEGRGIVSSPNGNQVEVVAANGSMKAVVQEEEKSGSFGDKAMDLLLELGAAAERVNAAQREANRQEPPRESYGAAFLKGEHVSGFNKICVYDTIKGEIAINKRATELCPLRPD